VPQAGQNQHSIVFVGRVCRADIVGVPFVMRNLSCGMTAAVANADPDCL
jgi:hypothetical protein